MEIMISDIISAILRSIVCLHKPWVT